jgi:predicted ferric reductase
VLITAGYAQAARTGPWHEAGTLLRSYPDILTATVGLALICLAGSISIRAIRRRVRREIWWNVHLFIYLALAISFAHVIVLGPSFVGHPLTQVVWSAAWAATAGLVLTYRVGLPVLRSFRHRLRVAEVRREGPDVVSVLRAARREDLVLGTEIADLVKRRGGQLHELIGDRAEASIDQYSLRRIVPDIKDRDVYVCGPEGFVTEIVALARWLGVPGEAIHHEAYAL